MAVETNCRALYSTQLFMPTLNCDSEYFRNKSIVKTTAYSCCFCSFPLIFKHFYYILKIFFFKKTLILQVFCLHVHMRTVCMQCPEARRGGLITWIWNYDAPCPG